MAKDLNRSIKIYLDHSDAMKKSQDFENRISKVNEKLRELNAQGKKDSPEYKKREDELRKLNASYGRYQEKLKETERILKNLSGATRGELEALRKELNKSLKDTTRNTDEYKAKVQTLIAVEKQLEIVKKEQNGTLGRNATLWSRMADGFNKYFGIVTSVIAGVTGLSFTLRKLAENVAQMDDVYADVMKTTGMTREQVLDLNEDFKKMDTRTARDELNNLARDAGKLGLNAKKDILDFVEAGNQINVALGEDLGEGAIKNIGKMTDVYARSTKELDGLDLKGKMLSIGSAINELGASSTASEAYMVSFTQRLGGVASQAGISIQNILGYASALDQSGQAVEMSATALQNFIMKLMGDPAKFAKIAGIEVSKFNNLLKKDTNEAIKLVLTSLSEKGGFQQLIPLFEEMGLDGARAVGVLSALATNIDNVNTAQKIANSAFSDGVSITNEYSIKNNNMQATLEKQRKAFNDSALELGERLNPMLLQSTKFTTYFIKMLPRIIDFFEKYGKYLLYMTVVYGLYVGGVKVAAAIESAYNAILLISRLRRVQVALATTQSTAAQTMYNNVLQNGSFITKAYTAVTSLLSAAKYLLTGNLTKARQAMQAFNVTTSLNPAGIAAGVVMALVAALAYLYMRTKDVMNAQNAVKKATEEFNEELGKEQSQANRLFEALKRTNPESDEFRKIKDQIIKLYGPYLKNMLDEKGNLIDIAAAQAEVNNKLRENISLKIKNAATDKIQEASVKEQVSDLDKVMEIVEIQMQRQSGYNKEAANAVRENINKTITEAIANGKTGVEELTKAIQTTIGQDAPDMHEKFGFWNPKSLYQAVSKLSSGINVAQNEIKKVEEQYAGMISEATILEDILKGDGSNGDDDYNKSLSDKELKKIAEKQKQELSLMLEALETKHQQRLFDLKLQYKNGEIKSESEYNTKIFSQEQAYYLLREQALTGFITKVSDKELKSDISKQIAELQNRRLDQELKFRQKLEQIILDADPEAKEKKEYENRLRDYKVFGETKESLRLQLAAAETPEEKKLLEDKLSVFELLEKQHLDNLVKIRKDGKAKLKAAGEEQFEEDFADRKSRLQQEIADEEQRITAFTGIGALRDSEAFNAELALQQKRIALVQEEVAARQKAGLDVSKLIKRQQSEEQTLTQLYVNEFKRRSQLSNQYAQDLGNVLGNVLLGQEDMLKGFGNVVLDILFDTLGGIINAKIAEATAVAIAEQAKAAAISAAQPDSVITFGASAIARTAAIGAIIMGALSAAKTVLKGLLGKKGGSDTSTSSNTTTTTNRRIVTPQQAQGKYDVIGEQDGKLYRNVPFAGAARTGVVSTPTLIAEEGSELVVSAPDFLALRKHINFPVILQAIQDVRYGRVPQRASGKYNTVDDSDKPSMAGNGRNQSSDRFDEMIEILKQVRDKELDFNIYEFERKKKTADNARNLAKRK